MGKYALFTVFALTFALIVYSHGIRNVQLLSDSRVTENYSTNQAANIAQSAAMIALYKIRVENDATFRPEVTDESYYFPEEGWLPWEELSGSYQLGIHNLGDSLVVVESIGQFEQAEYTVRVSLNPDEPIWDPSFDHAVFARDGFSLTGSSTIHGDAGTNSTANGAVSFGWATGVTGSLAIGPGGDPSTVVAAPNLAGNVGVDIEALQSPLDFTTPIFPPYPSYSSIAPSLHVSPSSPSSPIPLESYQNVFIPELRITGNASLTMLTGDENVNLHVGRLLIEQGHLHFEGEGNINVYVENEIRLSGSSTYNASGTQESIFTYYEGIQDVAFAGATNFNSGIYVRTADMTLSGSGGIKGNIVSGGDNVTISGNAQAITSRGIFAPEARVEMSGSSTARGAIIAREFSAVGNAQVFYEQDFDEDFPDLETDGDSYQILSWN